MHVKAPKQTHAESENSITGSKESTHEAQIVERVDAERKRFAALQDRSALADCELLKVHAGFILSRWNYSRHLIDLDMAQTFILHMEGCTK